MMLPESPHASSTQPIPGFHVYLHGSRFSGECSPEVSIVAPSTPAPVTFDLNATSMAGESSSGGMRNRQREMSTDMLTSAHNLFDEMPTDVDDDMSNRFLESMIFEGGAPAARAYSAVAYDPDETQNQDGRASFTQATNDLHDAFMQDPVVLDGFPLDHEFPEDYGLEEEGDDMDIDGEPLFEKELANQTVVGAKPKRKSKRTKAYTSAEDKLLCECWRDIGQDLKISAEQKWLALWTRVHREFHERKKFPPYQMQGKCGWVSLSKCWRVIQQECNKFCATYESIKACLVSSLDMQDMVFQALEAFKVQHDGKAFYLSHCWTIIKGEEKFKAQYAALLARGGKEAVEDHGGGEKAQPRGKTNSKKEDKRDATSIALLEKMEGMIRKKDLREEKRRQEKEEQMDAFMEIQRRRLEMDAERQAKMLELEEAKQDKMLEIEATNAETKGKEVTLTSMKTGVEIMKVGPNTVSPRKRLWFEKMQAKMFKFDHL
ncbi:DNA repair protein rhp54 [Hordeum vulgare]|nr:DNA repair protein rhp54 [Hordeum vulgare]